jgi:hypothetical protein
MKKYTSTALGGAPVDDDDLLDIFNSEIWAAIQGQLSTFDSDVEGIVISGCVTTANAGNFDMTEGIVYLNGEFMRISAVTNQTFTKYIAPATPVNDDRQYADGTTNTIAVTKGAGLVGSAPGSGQYIKIASLTDLDERRTISAPTKWNDIVPINGWTARSGAAKPQWRKANDGRVYLRGIIDNIASAATSNQILNSGDLPPITLLSASGIWFNVYDPNATAFISVEVEHTGYLAAVRGTTLSIQLDHINYATY